MPTPSTPAPNLKPPAESVFETFACLLPARAGRKSLVTYESSLILGGGGILRALLPKRLESSVVSTCAELLRSTRLRVAQKSVYSHEALTALGPGSLGKPLKLGARPTLLMLAFNI